MTPDIISGDEAAENEKIEQLQIELRTVHAHLRHLREQLNDLRAENEKLEMTLEKLCH